MNGAEQQASGNEALPRGTTELMVTEDAKDKTSTAPAQPAPVRTTDQTQPVKPMEVSAETPTKAIINRVGKPDPPRQDITTALKWLPVPPSRCSKKRRRISDEYPRQTKWSILAP